MSKNSAKFPHLSIQLSDTRIPILSSQSSSLKESLISSNKILAQQIEKNKKNIKSLKAFLKFIESLPRQMSSEVRALVFPTSDPTPYDFDLELTNELHKFICKSKYFKIELKLVSLTGKSICYYQKIPIEIKLYTSEDTPKEITQTMKGHNIIRGEETVLMTYHVNSCTFIGKMKVQIREVSSHYVSGTLSLVVRKKGDSELLIRPLVVKDLVVKAKEKTCQRLRGEEF